MSQEFETMKPSIRICLPMICIMLVGPAAGVVSLYIEIMPQMAKRALGLAASIAA